MTGQDGLISTQGNSLSSSQERLWVLDQLHPRSPVQNVSGGLHLPGMVEPISLEAAVREVVQRHEILRTEFQSVNGAPLQILLPSVPLKIRLVDLRNVSAGQRESELVRRTQEEVLVPFDITRGPLLRTTLFQLADAEPMLLVVAHRIVCDETSVRILLNEVSSRYRARISGQPGAVQETPSQYREIAGPPSPSQPELSYWKQLLAGTSTSIDLPTDRPRPPVQTFRGAKLRLQIERPLLARLRSFGQDNEKDLFATLLAAFYALLSRYSKQDDLVVGTRVSGRVRPEFGNLIGPFENMLALQTNVSGEPSFAELQNRVRDVIQSAVSHQDVPFEALVKELHLERDMSRHPLFQIMFSKQDDGAASAASPSGMIPFKIDTPTEQFDLSVEFATQEDQLDISFSYSVDLFDRTTIHRMMGHFHTLLESAAANSAAKISALPLLSDSERHQLLVEWNDTQVKYPTDIPLHRFIENQVEKKPDSTAVICEGERLTYGELNSRANQLAHHLKKQGVGPDVLVGVCAERSLELVIALLAVLKAGGAYVPLDPEVPEDRIETMLRDAEPVVLLTQSHLIDRLPAWPLNVFCLDRDWSSMKLESPDNLPAEVSGKNLAYAIYTSGSTGKPKGVPNVHEGIVNRLLWMQDTYKLTAQDRVLQKTPFSFDVSVWEFFWPLMAGSALVVARPGGHRDPTYLVSLIAEEGITTLHFVPSMLGIFLEAAGLERCRTVRRVFASGEALPFELQQRFFERLSAELHNLYGPTEAAVDVTYWACRPDSQQPVVPIGRPIANTQIYILDTHLQPVPIGVAGELHIGGIGLARGYLNRPNLTAEKFIPNPFRRMPGERLYKTGDLARFLPDGNIEYLGRIDHQVKLRGFRIELGEIEAVLAECSGVRQAVAVMREDRPGDKRLVAYFIATPGQKLEADRIRTQAKHKLPEYMVPSQFVVLDEFPMTTSGKVDRKALPAPPTQLEACAPVVAPRNELERQITSIFASVLGLPSVGIADNFFDLGGHSLLAARLLSQINESTGRQIPLSALFRGATVESLAQLLQQECEVNDDRVVMAIQHGDSSTIPFFAIVPPGEESLGYAILARHMGPEQTVYKIQGKAPVTRGKRPYSEEEMQALTREYIAAIRSVQPHGPYCLGGLCDGTHIAEQIVLSLESQGDDVGLFAIFDTWVLQHSQRHWLWKLNYYGQRLREMKDLDLSKRLAAYKQVAQNKLQNVSGRKPARTDWQDAYWPEDFRPWRFRAPVVLFKRPKQPFYYINDPQMGWGLRTESGVEVHEVDFSHLEILREPQVKTFGETLRECLARVSRQAFRPGVSTERGEPSRPTASAAQIRQDR